MVCRVSVDVTGSTTVPKDRMGVNVVVNLNGQRRCYSLSLVNVNDYIARVLIFIFGY